MLNLFDAFVMDRARRELTPSGARAVLEPDVLDLLAFLIDSRPSRQLRRPSSVTGGDQDETSKFPIGGWVSQIIHDHRAFYLAIVLRMI